MFDDEMLVNAMLDAGAKGYLLKSSRKEEIIKAIETVYEGGFYFDNQTNYKLFHSHYRRKDKAEHGRGKVIYTEIEMEIIFLVCKGFSSQEIAVKLRMVTGMVDKYRKRIAQKILAG